MCEEADSYCNSPPSQHKECGCCGTRGEPCCIDCYYCLAPFGMVTDIVCFPCNMYKHCLKCKQEKSGTTTTDKYNVNELNNN
jgi:hypothetical protein